MENTNGTPRGPRRGGRNRGSPYDRPAPSGDGMWLHDRGAGRVVSAAVVPTGQASTRLLVTNLHYEVTEQDLKRIFEATGSLTMVPKLRFDRSGRSTGVARVVYDRSEDARQAVIALNGAIAKGQPLKIKFDAPLPTAPQSGKSLLNRISSNNGSLLQRMGGTPQAAAATSNGQASGGIGPVRTRQAREPRPPRAAKPKPPKPATQDDLDKELDAYLAMDKKPAVEATVQEELAEMTL